MKLHWAVLGIVGAAYLVIGASQVVGQGGFSPAAAGAMPQYISYQGRLTDSTGKPVPDGTTPLDVTIWDAEVGGTALHHEFKSATQTVDGVFSVQVNCGQLAWDRPYWISVVYQGQEMMPRTPIASVGYAFKAADAYTVGGYAPSTVPQAGSLLVLDSQGKMPGSAIANGTIGVSQLGANAVTSAKIAPGAVEMTDIKNGAVGGDQLALGSVKQSHLTGECVGEGQLIPQSVTEGKLGDGAVTLAKLGANSVSGAKIQPGAVDGTKIAAGAVDSAQIKARAVDSAQIKDGAVGAAQIGPQAIGATHARITFGVTTFNYEPGERHYHFYASEIGAKWYVVTHWSVDDTTGQWGDIDIIKSIGSCHSAGDSSGKMHAFMKANRAGKLYVFYLAFWP